MKKNFVYSQGGGNMVCVMADDEFACLCPIVGHRPIAASTSSKISNGYGIKFSLAEVHSQVMETQYKEVGYIKDFALHIYKNNPPAPQQASKLSTC